MGIVETACKREKMKITADTLPREHRGVRAFQRLIAAVRAAEAEMQEHLSKSERSLNEALQKTLEMAERIQELEGQLLQYRLRDKLDQVPSLTVADKQRLLEMSPVA
jgi:hypothetical protein